MAGADEGIRTQGMRPLRIAAYTATSALGWGLQAALAALREGRSGLRPCDFAGADLVTWTGRVPGLESVTLPDSLAEFDCRNNRLAYLGLCQDSFREAVAAATRRYGAGRIGVFIGTTTSGILETETAYRQRDPSTGALLASIRYRFTHNGFSCTEFTRRLLGLHGPAHSVMTACSSSAKVFASAHRHLEAGLCDAAVVGGVDSLCLTTLYGFHALGLMSGEPCRPWDAGRDGLSIGEATGFALLRRAEPGEGEGIALLGYGESMDAYHASAPHPEGVGAALAMERALRRAGLRPADVDYINLHGTATPANDATEDRAVVTVFGRRTPCSSTKGWTGHTLGAAGVVEAVLACLCIEQGLVPGSLNTRAPDTALAANLQLHNRDCRVRVAMSNSFGFGGNNSALIVGALA